MINARHLALLILPAVFVLIRIDPAHSKNNLTTPVDRYECKDYIKHLPTGLAPFKLKGTETPQNLATKFPIPDKSSGSSGVSADDSNSEESWSILEVYVWNHLCDRKPFTISDWPKNLKDNERKISAYFIKAVIASNKFDIPGYNLIRIEGATITGELDLQHEILRSDLTLKKCIIEGAVTLIFCGRSII